MKNLIGATFLFLGLTTIAYAGGDAENGKTLSSTCVACHGADGNSPSPLFPKIAGLGEKYLLKQLVDIKSGARAIPEMTGLLDPLNDQELLDLAAFFAQNPMQLSGAKSFTLKLNSGEQIEALKLGEMIYRAGNMETKVAACSGCHSPSGKGNAPAAYPRLGGQYSDYIEKQLKAFRSGERDNDGEARIMRSVAKNMSDAEIKAVANYISGLH